MKYKSKISDNGILKLYIIKDGMENDIESGIPAQIIDFTEINYEKIIVETNNEVVRFLERKNPSARIEIDEIIERIIRKNIKKEIIRVKNIEGDKI